MLLPAVEANAGAVVAAVGQPDVELIDVAAVVVAADNATSHWQ